MVYCINDPWIMKVSHSLNDGSFILVQLIVINLFSFLVIKNEPLLLLIYNAFPIKLYSLLIDLFF